MGIVVDLSGELATFTQVRGIFRTIERFRSGEMSVESVQL